MSQIPCIKCPKIFRTPTGLAWHLDHIHRIEEKVVPDGSSGAGVGQADAEEPCADTENLPTQGSHTEDGLPTMLEEVQMSLDHNNANIDSLLFIVENLKARIASLGSLERNVAELSNEVLSLNYGVSTVESTSVHLSRLLWALDRDHRQKSLADLFVRYDSEEDLKQVRDSIRSILPCYQ